MPPKKGKKGKAKKKAEPVQEEESEFAKMDEATLREALAAMVVKRDKLQLDRNYVQLERVRERACMRARMHAYVPVCVRIRMCARVRGEQLRGRQWWRVELRTAVACQLTHPTCHTQDTISTFYDITRKEVTDLEREILDRDRVMEEMEKHHRVEVRVYIQKVKHLEYEHKNNLRRVEGRGDSQVHEEKEGHHERELSLKLAKQSLKLELKNQQLAYEMEIKAMKEMHQKNLDKLREDFENNLRAFRGRLEARLERLRQDLELRRKVEIHEIEERKNLHINDLMQKHEKAFGQIKQYYNDITHDNLKLIRTLKHEIAEMTRKAAENERLMFDIAQENKRLSEPLAEAVREVAQLQHELKDYEKDRLTLRNARDRLRVVQEQYVELQQRHAELRAEFERVERERDELFESFESAVRQVQRRSEFKNLVLERQLDTLHDAFERKQAQFSEVLRAANLDPTVFATVTRKLDEVLEQRNAMIRDLKYHIARVAKAHNDMVGAFEAKMRELGVPPEDTADVAQLEPTDASSMPAGLVVQPLPVRT